MPMGPILTPDFRVTELSGVTREMVTPLALMLGSVQRLKLELYQRLNKLCRIHITEYIRDKNDAIYHAEQKVWTHRVHGQIVGYGWTNQVYDPERRVWMPKTAFAGSGYIEGKYAPDSEHYTGNALDFWASEGFAHNTWRPVKADVLWSAAKASFDGYVRMYEDGHCHGDNREAWRRIQTWFASQ